MKNALPLLAALLLAAGVARAAPPVRTWEVETTRIWPRASTGAVADTLPRFGNTFATGDSGVVTDSVYVMNARYIVFIATSTGSDSLLSPLTHVQLPGSSTWLASTLNSVPFSGWSPAPAASGVRTVSSVAAAILGFYNETTIAGSTPQPMVNSYVRLKLKSSSLRRYDSANSATLAPTGGITVYALVWR